MFEDLKGHRNGTRTHRVSTKCGRTIDGGGVSMHVLREPSSPEQSQRVLLSIEVRLPQFSSLTIADNFQAKRKKHEKEGSEHTANRHAAQIFGEMLGVNHDHIS